MEVRYGWRSYQPSSARVRHIIIEKDGEPFSVCLENPMVLTEAVVDAMPKAFPKNQVAKLKALPECGMCIRRLKARQNPRLTHKQKRLYIESLERKVASLEAEVLALKLRMPSNVNGVE